MARKTTGQRIVEMAEQELGVKEIPDGSNSGPRVRDYQNTTWFAGTTGWPWCVAFAWTFTVWTRVLKKNCPYKTASVAQLEAWARKNGWAGKPPLRVGDLACLNHGEHVTIVANPDVSAGLFVGLGGNQGNSVCKRAYRTSAVTTIVRVPPVIHSSISDNPAKSPVYELVRGEGGQAKVVFRNRNLDRVLGRAASILAKGATSVRVRKRKG